MNYYTNSGNCCFMNNRNDKYRYNNDFYDNYYNTSEEKQSGTYDKQNYSQDQNRSCCVRRVEETLFCFPSYYSEEKKEEKECNHCWEGTIKLCPKHEENKKDKYHDEKENHSCHCHNKCGFCGLFRRW